MTSTQRSFLFTSESVTEGHPDKICDQVSDGILDALLEVDPHSRVACETLVKTGMVVVAGEITTKAGIEYPKVIRQVVKDIGYVDGRIGFDGETCGVLVAIERQSPDIALGVDEAEGKEQGAGDQGLMFGFACDETPELMPMPILYAHRITKRLAEARKKAMLPWLRPDGKSQVTVEYRDGKPARVDTVVVAAQHNPEVKTQQVRDGVVEEVVRKVIAPEFLDKKTRFLVNTTGRFVIGGPQGDAGVTGRKIIADTYGGRGRHGGGAFSGKDPSKVDRSAAYMARYVAKNLVAAQLARQCEIQIAYSIGVAEPVSVMVDSFGTGAVDDARLSDIVKKEFDLRPKAIIKSLDLLRPIYRKTAAYGHFGRTEPEFSWERTDRKADLRKAAGI